MKIRRKPSSNQRTLQDILDSDDELSGDFVESPYIPAYQDDTRFEYYEKLNEKRDSLKNENITKSAKLKEETLKNGILKKEDVLFLQYVQRHSNDTVLWFFGYLIYKDLHSNYKFLKSCLIPKYEHYSKFIPESVDTYKPKSQYRYNLIVNK